MRDKTEDEPGLTRIILLGGTLLTVGQHAKNVGQDPYGVFFSKLICVYLRSSAVEFLAFLFGSSRLTKAGSFAVGLSLRRQVSDKEPGHQYRGSLGRRLESLLR